MSQARRTILCRTSKALANELINNPSNINRITIVPPEDTDQLTDEDDIAEDETGEQQINTDIAGLYEVELDDGEQAEENLEIPKSTIKTQKKEKRDSSWKNHSERRQCSFEKLPFDDKQSIMSLEGNLPSDMSPVEIFEKFFDNDVFQLIMDESSRYAFQTNKHRVKLDIIDIKAFLGFLFFTGYHTLPRERLYWSQREDFGVELVKQLFSRDRYIQLKSILHFANNDIPLEDKTKDFKIAPLYAKLNENFKQFGIHDEYLSIDEQMVKYFGRNSLKQFIRNKPIRFGMKNWATCGESGYCYHAKLYCGKENDCDKRPLGTRVVTEMVETLKPTKSNCIVMDNFFCSHDLLCELKEMEIPAIGTMRENRVSGCPLADEKTLKQQGRGTSDNMFDSVNEIAVTKWLDNRAVIVGANFDISNTKKTCQRWTKGQGRIDISVPPAVHIYNKGMGGVDLMDNFVNAYRIAIASKKWYWCLFTVLADIAVSNAWILYRKVNVNAKMDQLDFKSSIALTYLKLAVRNSSVVATGRITSALPTVRFSEGGHFLTTRTFQRRCQGSNCSSKPTTFCSKCNITLCKKCFPVYHSK